MTEQPLRASKPWRLRGRGMLLRSVARLRAPLALAVTLLVSGCSGADVVEGGPGSGAPASATTSASSFTDVDRGYPNWASTSKHLVGFSGFDTDDPEVSPRYGSLDLDSGRVSELPAPQSARILNPLAIVGLDRTAILVASECESPPSEVQPLCSPGTLALYSVDPVSAEGWTRRELPESLAKATVHAVSNTQPLADTVAVITSASGDESAGRVLRISEETTEDLNIAVPTGREHCLSGGVLYTLRVASAADPIAPAAPSLLRTESGAAPAELPLPEVSPAYGGISARLACTDEGVFITSSAPPPSETPPTTWERQPDGSWQERRDLSPSAPSLALSSLSSSDAVAIQWDGADAAADVLLTARADAPATSHPETGVMAWRGLSGDILLIDITDEDTGRSGVIREVTP